ncbi:MAG: flagellar biosynthesis protein FlhF [Rubrivivax sp.]|nr:flagellar biosynthesis protein FlhF [Rubrivivax sp.]
MNLKRFTGRTSRDALALVRQAFGDDAVVMSTKPCAEGVEVLAMAPESVAHLERVGAHAPRAAAAEFRSSAFGASTFGHSTFGHSTFGEPSRRAAAPAAAAPPRTGARGAPAERIEPTLDGPPVAGRSVAQDVQDMQMSTLSFQDYVRERMLKRRQAEMTAATPAAAPAALPPAVSPIAQARARLAAQQAERFAPHAVPAPAPAHDGAGLDAALRVPGVARAAAMADVLLPPATAVRGSVADAGPALHRVAPVARAEPAPLGGVAGAAPRGAAGAAEAASRAAASAPPRLDGRGDGREGRDGRAEQAAMLTELRSMRGLIEQRFGALAFMEKLQCHPRQAQLTQRLLEAGFSPALTRRLAECLPAEVDEMSWAAGVLERNLGSGERDVAIEEAGGVYALIGATGVGKTTSTAKLAAAFAARHGAANLGLVTLDAYRVAAHEQLRAYGRILGVPVHTAHDRASLEDLLELLAGKRMVLIDTAGMAQRDARTRELLDMLQRPAIQRLVVVSAAAQGETIEDQLTAYAAPGCRGVVLTKVDEAVKLAPALDAMIRARLKVLAVANGQRVPEDWHRLSSHALVQRALRASGAPAWRMEPGEVNLVFAGPPFGEAAAPTAGVAAPPAGPGTRPGAVLG